MKLVNLETFLAMPEDTLYAELDSLGLASLSFKGDTRGRDFDCTTVTCALACDDDMDILEGCYADGVGAQESIPLDFERMWLNDLPYLDNDVFAVWEPDDVRALIARLGRCVHSEDATAPADALRRAHARLEAWIASMQRACVEHIKPNGPTWVEFVDEILELLDGPEQREAQEGMRAAVEALPR